MEGDDERRFTEEACYYLQKLGLSNNEIAKRLEIKGQDVKKFCKAFRDKIRTGLAEESQEDMEFWAEIEKAEKDPKVTFVGKDGIYHGRRSDLERMDSKVLISFFESSKHFLDLDPNKRFLEAKVPSGYDPLVLLREVKKALEIIQSILEERETT